MSIIDELIFDRTDEDLEVAKNYIKNNQPLPSDNLRYSWDCRALNRTEEAMEYVNEIFKELGYFRNMEFKTDWFADEITPKQSERYISNLKVLRNYLTMPSDTPATPNTINGMTIERANEIEKIIYDIDIVLEALQNNLIYCNVCNLGQDRVWQQRFRRKITPSYIESTGTQYIDTGVVPNQNIGYEIDFMPLNDTPSRSSPPSFLNSGGNGTTGATNQRVTITAYATFNGASGELQLGNQKVDPMIRKGERTKITLKNKVLTRSDGIPITLEPNSFNGYNSFYIFASHNETASRFSKMRLYSLKLYDGDELIRDFIPKTLEDGYFGLLDRVENKTYFNQGSGYFIANFD